MKWTQMPYFHHVFHCLSFDWSSCNDLNLSCPLLLQEFSSTDRRSSSANCLSPSIKKLILTDINSHFLLWIFWKLNSRFGWKLGDIVVAAVASIVSSVNTTAAEAAESRELAAVAGNSSGNLCLPVKKTGHRANRNMNLWQPWSRYNMWSEVKS